MHALPVPTNIASTGVPLNSAVPIPAGVSNSAQTTKQWMVKQRPAHSILNVGTLRQQLDMSREADFMEYFKDPNNYSSLNQQPTPVAQVVETPRFQRAPVPQVDPQRFDLNMLPPLPQAQQIRQRDTSTGLMTPQQSSAQQQYAPNNQFEIMSQIANCYQKILMNQNISN